MNSPRDTSAGASAGPNTPAARTIGQGELDAIFAKHERYVRRAPGGLKANLAFHDLNSLNLDGRDLSEADFSGAKLRFAWMKKTRLAMSNLFAADLSVANLEGADLIRADMRGGCCRGTVLIDATMVEADLREGVLAKFGKGGARAYCGVIR
jgi:uncharacterized protein YjbI with pentapeptide repeats